MAAEEDAYKGGKLLKLRRRSDVVRRHVGDAVVLDHHGDLDLLHAARLAAEVGEALRARPRRLVLGLCRTSFLDATGLAVLAEANQQTRQLGIELRVACDVPATLRVLELTRLDRSLDLYPTLETALGLSPTRAIAWRARPVSRRPPWRVRP